METFIQELIALVLGDPAIVEAGTQIGTYFVGAVVAWVLAIAVTPFFPAGIAVPLQKLLTAFIPHLLTALVRALQNRKAAAKAGAPVKLAAEVKTAVVDALKPSVPLKQIGRKATDAAKQAAAKKLGREIGNILNGGK